LFVEDRLPVLPALVLFQTPRYRTEIPGRRITGTPLTRPLGHRGTDRSGAFHALKSCASIWLAAMPRKAAATAAPQNAPGLRIGADTFRPQSDIATRERDYSTGQVNAQMRCAAHLRRSAAIDNISSRQEADSRLVAELAGGDGCAGWSGFDLDAIVYCRRRSPSARRRHVSPAAAVLGIEEAPPDVGGLAASCSRQN